MAREFTMDEFKEAEITKETPEQKAIRELREKSEGIEGVDSAMRIQERLREQQAERDAAQARNSLHGRSGSQDIVLETPEEKDE